MIVSDATELTAEWFTKALGGVAVTDVHLTPMNMGAMCRMVRAELTRGDETQPTSVVVKFPTDEPGTLALARAMGMYELEVRFYRDLLPFLDGVRTPACHLAALDEERVGTIALAGFMRILSPWFVSKWQGRILNIHPSLLPKYRGLDTHSRALAAGDRAQTMRLIQAAIPGAMASTQ